LRLRNYQESSGRDTSRTASAGVVVLNRLVNSPTLTAAGEAHAAVSVQCGRSHFVRAKIFSLLRSSGLVFPPSGRCAEVAIGIALVIGYALLLSYFGFVDFYHNEFFVRGPQLIGYQLLRLTFVPYLAWTIYFVGALLCGSATTRQTMAGFSPWERHPLYFIIGAGVWHIVMFGIGLAGFDLKAVALALTLTAMVCSAPHLMTCICELSDRIAQTRFVFTNKSLALAPLWTTLFAVSILFVLVKGLYPGGGHDYYNHYFQFYKRVIETGSILPNDVWYHFYYSKGAGLYFLGMLLTDPLAPQLVATAFIACGAVVVYAILRHGRRASMLPLVGVLLYVGAYIYTSTFVNMYGEVQWGILEKIHELTAVLLLAVIWIASRAFRCAVSSPAPWMLGLHGAIITIALLTLSLTLLVGLYMTGYVFWFAITGQWRLAVRPLGAATTAGLCLLVMGAINYHYTGLPSDQEAIYFWPYADVAKIMQWGTMLELVTQMFGVSRGIVPNALPVSWQTLCIFGLFLRLQLWWPIFLVGLPLVLFNLRTRKSRTNMLARVDAETWGALIWFAVAVTIVAVFGGGRSQPISFYRLSTFSLGPSLCLALLFFDLGLIRRDDANHSYLRTLAPFATALAVIAILSKPGTRIIQQNFTPILRNALRLASGQFSLKEAYQHQEGWLVMPWGAIYPGVVEPWRIAGRGTRIWSFHIWSYCMLPDCNMQEFLSERFSKSWQTVLFGQPEQGIDALRREGLNYFFFSSELPMTNDLLATSEIFSPDEISNRLAVRWTDGTSYLLTWPDETTQPIDEKFLDAYRHAVEGGSGVDLSRGAHLKSISDYLKANKNDLRPFCLPWLGDCRGVPLVR
jgi:hypothetical protein